MTASQQPGLRVFLDSSVVIAGCISRQGASFALLRLAEVRLIDARISPDVREESLRNLRRKAPAALPMLGVILREAISEGAPVTDAAILVADSYAHPKDVLILAAAIEQKCPYLVTLNERDFWPPASLITVIRPGDLLYAVRKQIGLLVS